MTKSFKLAIATSLAILSFTATASAAESLPERAVAALGTAITSQGNAARQEIKRELQDALMRSLKPSLPRPAPEPQAAQPPAVNR